MSAGKRQPRAGSGDRPTVFVQHGWRAGWWACRSLASAGFRVIGGQDESSVANHSRFCSRLVRYPSPAEQPAEFLRAVERICEENDVEVVLPLTDEVVDLLATSLPRPGGAVVVGPTAEQFRRLADKSTVAELAQEAGFAYPYGVVVGPEGPRGEWPPIPSVVKPRITGIEAAKGLDDRAPALVRSKQERDAAVSTLVETVGEALVEERLQGDAWRVHFVRGPERTVTLTLRVIRSYPLHTGTGAVLRVAAPPPGLVPAARRLLELVGYEGPGSIQVIEADGRYFAHDVNLRLPITVGGTIAAGLDMPRLAVECALGRPLDSSSLRIKPVTYVSLADEVHRLLDGLHGRETDASVPRIAGDLLLAALAPNRVLDPFHLRDPVPMIQGPINAWRASRRRSLIEPEQTAGTRSSTPAGEGRGRVSAAPVNHSSGGSG
jgi:predicted ATP-grasp superfamily ATP-dependent carboligase